MSLQEVSNSSRAPHIQTSLVEVTDKLPFKPPCRILFKNEYEQPSGSFKLRGIGRLIQASIQRAIRSNEDISKLHVFASSGGNAGLAAAYLARFYGIRCTVALPTVSKANVRAKLELYGAKLLIYGNNINEADKYLKTIIASVDHNQTIPIYCHPFDNPDIWEGHSSVMDEVATQLDKGLVSKVRGIVCSVGGGGLYNGIYKGIQQNNMTLDVILVECNEAPTFSETIKANKIVTLNSVKSVATSLACSHLNNKSLEYYHNNSIIKTHYHPITDNDAIRGSVQFYDTFGTVVEPACGAAVCTVFNQMEALTNSLEHLSPDDIVVIVVCGGLCSSFEDIVEFKRLLRSSRL